MSVVAEDLLYRSCCLLARSRSHVPHRIETSRLLYQSRSVYLGVARVPFVVLDDIRGFLVGCCYRSRHSCVSSSFQAMAAITRPATLRKFFCFNPTYGKKEGTEREKVLFYHPSSTPVEVQTKHIGLAEAFVNFTRYAYVCACVLGDRIQMA